MIAPIGRPAADDARRNRGEEHHAARTASRSRPATLVAQAAVAGLASVLAVVLVDLPWLPWKSVAVACFVSVPPALSLAAALTVAAIGFHRAALPLPSARLSLAATVALLVSFSGVFAANRFLIEGPLGRRTLIGYLITACACVLCVRATGPQGWLGPLGRRLDRRSAAILAMLVTGTLACLTEAIVMPEAYANHHVSLLTGALFAFQVAAFLVLRRHGLTIGAAATALLWLVVCASSDRGSLGGRALLADGRATAHKALLRSFWRHTDRDGDGYSALLGGGDCDDADAGAFPLGPQRDCLGWTGEEPGHFVSVTPRPPEAATGPRPHVIVLVTVDALRCDLPGGHGEGCPSLRRLAQQGHERQDAHSPAPGTIISFDVMHRARSWVGGERPTAPLTLMPAVARAGLVSHVVVTHPHVLPARDIRAAFTEVDDSLSEQAHAGDKATAHAVSEKIVGRVSRALAPGEAPLFLWAHQFDAHAPYVPETGVTFIGSRTAAYAAEVRRTDAAIGWMANRLNTLPRAAEILVIVTADHGEEFGEHGRTRHGFATYEESTRIPMIAWSPGPVGRRFTPGDLPGSLIEMTAFIEAVTAGVPFRSRGQFLVSGGAPLDRQLALVTDGWKLIHHAASGHQELYDLRADPGERHDRAATAPDQVLRLGRRLAAEIAAQR